MWITALPRAVLPSALHYFFGVVAAEELLVVGAVEGFAPALTAEGFLTVPVVVEGFALITMAVD